MKVALVALALALPACVPPPGSLTDAQLRTLRECESHGIYTAVSKSGTYRGAYQFSRTTWANVGGQGDPAAAHPFEQDTRARILFDRAGRSPWPVCGKRI